MDIEDLVAQKTNKYRSNSDKILGNDTAVGNQTISSIQDECRSPPHSNGTDSIKTMRNTKENAIDFLNVEETSTNQGNTFLHKKTKIARSLVEIHSMTETTDSLRRCHSLENLTNIKSDESDDNEIYELPTMDQNENSLIQQFSGDSEKSSDSIDETTRMRNIKAGYLYKKISESVGNNWMKWWFVIENKKLTCYEDDTKKHLIGQINFEITAIELKYKPGYVYDDDKERNVPKNNWNISATCCCSKRQNFVPYSFPCISERMGYFFLVLSGMDRILELMGPYKEVEEWIYILENSIKKCSKDKIRNSVLILNYWSNQSRINEIPPSTLEDIAKTGDILLFKSRFVVSALLRTIMNGEYDHVALLLRCYKGNIFIFEAISEGVTLTPWRIFIKNDWHKVFKKIAIRQLVWDRTPEKINKLLRFVLKSLGSPYHLSFKKLLRRYSSGDSEDFFCSQLVASVYKLIGAIPNEAVCSQFWPSTFSKNFNMMEGYSLEDELIINFDMDPEYKTSLRGESLCSTKSDV